MGRLRQEDNEFQASLGNLVYRSVCVWGGAVLAEDLGSKPRTHIMVTNCL